MAVVKNAKGRKIDNSKKVYQRPMLSKFGSIRVLTAGATGSAWDSTPNDGRTV